MNRALEMVSSGDESPNYKALSVQVRKPYEGNRLQAETESLAVFL